MIPSNRKATHPGIILLKEFLEPLQLTPKGFATHVDIPLQRINEIIKGKRSITPETAWVLSEAFSTSPEFWLNLQSAYDLTSNRPTSHIQPLIEVGAY